VFSQKTFNKIASFRLATLLFAVQLVSTGLPGTAIARQDSSQKRVTRSFTQPIEQSVVASSQMGVIQVSKVKEGDRVSAGDTLAVISHQSLIESRRIAVAKSESTAKLDAAQSRLRMVTSQKETLESLIDGGHVNNYEVEQKTSEFENAQAEYRVAQDEMELARLEVKKIDAEIGEHVIKSPIDGFVTVIHKQPGEYSSNSEPQYATVVRLDQLKVRFYLDEETLSSIEVGSIVRVLVGKQLQPRTATVIFVSPIIDPDSGTGRVEVALDNTDLQLKSGIVCHWQSTDDSPTRRTASTQRERKQK